jgi:glutaminyl-tRNA synthetase
MDVPSGIDWLTTVNPNSIDMAAGAMGEPSLASAVPGDFFQFERLGYFIRDPDFQDGKPVFNRSVSLKDSWAKIEKKGG